MNRTPPECQNCLNYATTGYITIFGEVVPLCKACLVAHDNYDGPPDQEGEPSPSIADLHMKAWRQKHYGEGL